MTSLLDATAPKHEIAESLVVYVEAAPTTVLAAVDRVAPRPSRRAGAERVFATADLAWDVRVESDGEGGSYVSSTRRFLAADDAAREAMLDRWREVSAAADAANRRMLRTVKRLAEHAPAEVALAVAA